jgi:hypothetical protein
MKALRYPYWVFAAALLCGHPTTLFAQESGQRRSLGAPQTLEIPSVQDTAPPADPEPQSLSVPPVEPQGAADSYDPYYDENPSYDERKRRQEVFTAPERRNYLGVLYATAEGEEKGVKVLSVVEGSPAARAGFEGADAPPSGKNDLMKAAIVVLAMSPAGPFAIPLAIAHDLYTTRHSPGDLIVAVDSRPVVDALQFNEIMRPYKPGDTVTFSIVRQGKPSHLTVQLAEEPL